MKVSVKLGIPIRNNNINPCFQGTVGSASSFKYIEVGYAAALYIGFRRQRKNKSGIKVI